jgi:hypothetical protein
MFASVARATAGRIILSREPGTQAQSSVAIYTHASGNFRFYGEIIVNLGPTLSHSVYSYHFIGFYEGFGHTQFLFALLKTYFRL